MQLVSNHIKQDDAWKRAKRRLPTILIRHCTITDARERDDMDRSMQLFLSSVSCARNNFGTKIDIPWLKSCKMRRKYYRCPVEEKIIRQQILTKLNADLSAVSCAQNACAKIDDPTMSHPVVLGFDKFWQFAYSNHKKTREMIQKAQRDWNELPFERDDNTKPNCKMFFNQLALDETTTSNCALRAHDSEPMNDACHDTRDHSTYSKPSPLACKQPCRRTRKKKKDDATTCSDDKQDSILNYQDIPCDTHFSLHSYSIHEWTRPRIWQYFVRKNRNRTLDMEPRLFKIQYWIPSRKLMYCYFCGLKNTEKHQVVGVWIPVHFLELNPQYHDKVQYAKKILAPMQEMKSLSNQIQLDYKLFENYGDDNLDATHVYSIDSSSVECRHDKSNNKH